ncbi:myoinhibiting peptide precursor isoform 2-T3 [Cochliomyia hominivorax]
MAKYISLNQPWTYLFTLQILLALTVLNTKLVTVSANAVTPEIPTVSDNENQFMMENDDEMQHPWSKRAASEADFNAAFMENGEVMPVLAILANPYAMEQMTYENIDADEESIGKAKRGWKKMNVAWGKRRNAGQYMNRAASTWGKREPNWNNLKGMWGKRASKIEQWNNLRGSWGKRSVQFPETN